MQTSFVFPPPREKQPAPDETAGTKALAWIKEMIRSGKTIYICTMTMAIVISPETVHRWNMLGKPLLKLKDGDLYIASGKSFNKLTSGGIALVGFKTV